MRVSDTYVSRLRCPLLAKFFNHSSKRLGVDTGVAQLDTNRQCLDDCGEHRLIVIRTTEVRTARC